MTDPAVMFGVPAFEPPLTPSSTAPAAELKVALPLPALIEPIEQIALCRR